MEMKRPGPSSRSTATSNKTQSISDRGGGHPWNTLKLLGDETRLRIISLLSREELSVAELQEILTMGQSRISSHLALLRKGSIVRDRREGKNSFYSLNEDLQPESLSLVHAA